MTTPSVARKVVIALTLGAVAACMAPEITDSTSSGRSTSQSIGDFEHKLIKCPTLESASTSAVVTPLGGLLTVGGTSVSIPAGALLTDATVTLTVPASKYMEVDISVAGFDYFVFEQDFPITVTVSYARCANPALDLTPLTAWYVDFEDKQMLEEMTTSVDNKLTRTVTFTTGHLSGYALAD
jgi:hypothetical protein